MKNATSLALILALLSAPFSATAQSGSTAHEARQSAKADAAERRVPARTRTAKRIEAQQAAAEGRRVAAAVEAFYNQAGSVSARFYQTYWNNTYGRYTRSKGTLNFVKPGKMRMNYAGPDGKVIATDGEQFTMWEPFDGGPGQYVQVPMARASLPGAFAFLMGQGNLLADYRVRTLDATRYRFDGHVLELRPKKADPRYRRILLFVDKDPSRLGVVHTIRIDDHEKNRNKFELSGMSFKAEGDPSSVVFTPPRGARRIQG